MNDAAALLSAHDKLLTARLLRRFGIRHPVTTHVRPGRRVPPIRPPVVVKPRFGSGGRGVVLCSDEHELYLHLAQLEDHLWFRDHGVLVQELVPPRGYDLRLLLAHERVVGSVIRIAAKGEWRTNISLGGLRQPIADPPSEAIAVAMVAARAVGGALVGVDLVLDEQERWTVIEVNGAVEFTSEYLQTRDVYGSVLAALEGPRAREVGRPFPHRGRVARRTVGSRACEPARVRGS